MLKLMFDKDVNIFFIKYCNVETLRMALNGALQSDFIFVNIKPYKSKKCLTQARQTRPNSEGGCRGLAKI